MNEKKCPECGKLFTPSGVLPSHLCPECLIAEAKRVYNKVKRPEDPPLSE